MALKSLLKTTTVISLVISANAAFGQELTSISGIEIRANNDGVTAGENIVFTIGGGISTSIPLQTQMTIATDGTTINDALSVIGSTTTTTLTVSGPTALNSTLNVVGNADFQEGVDILAGGLNVTGATDLNSGLNVDGLSTLDDTTIDGTTLITGATSINTSGTNTTNIGNSASTTGIVGTTSITGSTTVLGTTSINTSGGDNTTIGNASTTTAIVGTTSITGGTSINTTGSSATTIGNASAATDVTMVGGSSRVALADGTTSINTTSGAANTSIGVAGNTTSIMSTSILVGNATTASNVLVGAGTAANTIVMGNGVGGTSITAAAGNTEMAMQNGSITNTVTSGEGVSGGTVVANNGSARWVADANGQLTEVTSDDATSGTTAAMVVTNSAGRTHGVVVQETKTTISGGSNSSSLTLADNGATFSDSATGRPIQVHGVADGTADFDAVNVRQLYSGLAAVLAASPELNLAPGKSGMGIGFGGYGGFSAIGIGFGHMYHNGAVVKASVSKAERSEIAYSASVSWNW